jgi:beta-phosphoglucomutase-like phosphatase (HAD superfamily)
MLRAILCELEGVLVQTTSQRRSAMSRAIASLGGSLPDDWRSQVTEPPIVPGDAEHALRAAGLEADQTNIDLAGLAASNFFCENVSINGVILAPGAISLMREAAAQVKLALVTRARRREVEAILAHTPFADGFSFVIAEEDASRRKPHPDPYMKALDRLRLPPDGTGVRDVLALEHGAPGIASAVAAGVRCVAVGPFEQAAGVAPVGTLPSLDGTSVELLARYLEYDPEVAV